MSDRVAVVGALRRMPEAFPTGKAENAGNMVHANAPLGMFPDVLTYEPRSATSWDDFVRRVNRECSHVVLTLDNMLRLDRDDTPVYEQWMRRLDGFRRPIVVFGLGAQADAASPQNGRLPAAGVEFVRFLASRSEVLGVRGEFTRRVVEDVCGVSSVVVTGCPSFFSRADLLERLAEPRTGGIAAWSGTHHHDPRETKMLVRAVEADLYVIEPVNRWLHLYAVEVSQGRDAAPPYFLRDAFSTPEAGERLARWVSRRYRLFRQLDTWSQFLDESVSFTVGTRFHANTAALLSGVPALWVTHDTRTRELTDFFALPAVELDEVMSLTLDELRDAVDLRPFIERYPHRLAGFRSYLADNGLTTWRAGA